MTRSIRSLAAVVLVILGSAACSTTVDDRPTVVVSTNILGDVVRSVVGDEARVVTLMKPNADPHSFEISAQDGALLRSADLVVSNGLGLEEGLQQHLDAAAAEQVPMFVAGEAVDVLDYRDGDAAGTPDSHFWTDPTRMIDVVTALEPVLAGLDGVDRDTIAVQTADYTERLTELDRTMAATFDAVPRDRRALVTNHHVFGYLADRYDFDVVGTVIPGGTTLAAPSASDLSDLVDALERTGVPAVFAESSAPDRLVRALADEADLEVRVVELFSESLTEPEGGAPDYPTMMRANADRIADGLAP